MAIQLMALLDPFLPDQVLVPVWALLSLPLVVLGIVGTWITERRHR